MELLYVRNLSEVDISVPISGTTEMHRFEEDLGTANIQLTGEELAHINENLSKIDVNKTHF